MAGVQVIKKNKRSVLGDTLGALGQGMAGFGAGQHNATMLRFAGAVQDDDTGEVIAVEIVTRGRIAEIDRGSAKVGEGTEHTYKCELSYYKETVNGTVLAEIDFVNMIEIIDGVDNQAAVRAAIGM